jgi:alpha-beta hydrolase superfamily lysophospholipase
VAAVVAVVLAVGLLGVSALVHAGSPRPDAFYTPPQPVPTGPGWLLRSEAFTRGVPPGALAWRILYTTTLDEATPAVASAIVLRAATVPPGPRPVIAWAHGTTGVRPECAPSLLDDPFGAGAMPALDHVIQRGWILVATDYPGLGTKGPHPYLIGEGQARSVLDAVRAARQLDSVSMAPQTVVWGHSQGGHAALWTSMLAAEYAPDAEVIGVVAMAPASDLLALTHVLDAVPGGVIFAAYLLQAYSDSYPDVRFNDYVRPTARVQLREMASRCLAAPETFVSVISSLLFDRPFWSVDPASGVLGERLRENVPDGPFQAPLLIAQGEDDSLILPSMQAAYVRQRCASGALLEYRSYPGRNHLGLVGADSELIPDLLQWTQDRLDGRPPPRACPR